MRRAALLTVAAALAVAPLVAQPRIETVQKDRGVELARNAERIEAPAPLAYSGAKEAAARAQELEREGDFEAAIDLLRSAAGRCAAGDAGASCRALLNYALGYAHQSHAEATGEAGSLARAASAYERVLADRPSHSPTLRNLARVRRLAGDSAGAAKALAATVFAADGRTRRDDATAGDAVELGDLLAERGDGAGALAAYRAAAANDPQAATPRRRLVGFYQRFDPTGRRAAALLEELDAWGGDFPEEARRGYLWVVQTAHAGAPGDREVAERALVSLVTLLLDRDRLTAKSLAGLPADWPPAADLASYLTSGSWSDAGWWGETREREAILARVALAQGKRWLARARGATDSAEAARRTQECWSGAVAHAPEEDLGPGWMDLFTDLGALLTDRAAELDPDGDRFARLESQLFGGKGEAYRKDDLEAIQRFHTVLGLIYADRGVWTSERPFRNATFQLSRAVAAAERRGEEGAPEEPLAKIKATLAGGYEARGDKERAYRTYLAAAAAYLDSDQIAEAGRVLATGRRVLPAERRELPREVGLSSLIALRAAAAEPRGCAEAQSGWGTRGASGLDPGFLSRQRFKVLADCAQAVAGEGELATRSALFAQEAVTLVVEEQITLVGSADVLRFEKAAANLERSGMMAAGPTLAPGSYEIKSTLGDGRRKVKFDVQRLGASQALVFNWDKVQRVDGVKRVDG